MVAHERLNIEFVVNTRWLDAHSPPPGRSPLRTTLARHAETTVAMLKSGHRKARRDYRWSYCTTVWDEISAVVFDFAERRAGQNARRFEWS